MTGVSSVWLDPLRTALDESSPVPVAWFFRDDDAGWADDRLWPLIEVCAAAGATLDVAAIPEEVTPPTGAALGRLADGATIAIHQHGRSHVNHEATGRSCEFGSARAADDQAADLTVGRDILEAAIGGPTTGVFVPPWNRCSEVTVGLLAELGFAALSRDESAFVTSFPEVRVCADWTRLTREGGLPALAGTLARAVRRRAGGRGEDDGVTPAVGLMLHHADLGAADLSGLAQLLDLVANHPGAECVPLASLASTAGATQGAADDDSRT